MEDRHCAGRWGIPTALQLHGLLLLWVVSMIFFPLLVRYLLPPCGVRAQAISAFTLKKEKGQCAWVKLPPNGIFSGTQELPPSQARVRNSAAQGPSGDTSLPCPTLTRPMAQRSFPSFALVPLFN